MINSNRADALIAFLNELAKIDPAALSQLVAVRVPCNDELGQHPTVQTLQYGDGGPYSVGILGLLNGFCGVIDGGKYDGYGPITAVSEDGQLAYFRRTEPELASGKAAES